MATLFCVRPATRNIGNDVINKATADLLYTTFGNETGLINIPALAGLQFGGFTAKQVYDMNRFADGVVVGGGNLFENGQLSIDRQALAALRVPMMIVGLSHARVYHRDGELSERTDAMAPDAIRLLVSKSCAALVRDGATQAILRDLGIDSAEIAGCPTLTLATNSPDWQHDGTVLISVRHPARMSVPPTVQWRVVEHLRRLIEELKQAFGPKVVLACHDYADIEFAAGFPEAGMIYYDDVERYIQALRRCRLNITFRLHAFLPCLAFGTPTVHLSYDERGASMVAASGMAAWDINILSEVDVVAAVMKRARDPEAFQRIRKASQPALQTLRQRTDAGLARFSQAVEAYVAKRK
jgi:Polysaccharide pyruvyl transferase